MPPMAPMLANPSSAINTSPLDNVSIAGSSSKMTATTTSTSGISGLGSIGSGAFARDGGSGMMKPEDFVSNPNRKSRGCGESINATGRGSSGSISGGVGVGVGVGRNSRASRVSSSKMRTNGLSRQSSYRKASYSKASYTSSNKMSAIVPRSSGHTSQASASGSGLRDLTINKLRFQNVDLYGREEELKLLRKSFEDSFENSAREFVLLSGHSGTGKSRLCQELYRSIKGGFYFNFHGKFNRTNNLPYAGFALACEKFVAFLFDLKAAEIPASNSDEKIHCELRQSTKVRKKGDFRTSISHGYNIVGSGNTSATKKATPTCVFSYSDIVDQLNAELDKQEMRVLTKFISIFDKIFTIQDDSDVAISTDDYAQLNLQFVYAFKKFIRVVATFSPLIMTLDDIQWSDEASLNLLRALVTDFENGCGTLFIGCYRKEEVSEGHPLLTFAAELEESAERFEAKLTKIVCGNLEVDHVNNMIADLMSDDSGRTRELAELVHRKTMGNALFCIQYLASLTDMNLLTFSLGKFEWQWNLEEIDLATSSTDNVVDLMLHKLQKLPDGVTRLLPLIASLGFSFQNSVFNLVVNHFNILFSKEDDSFEFLQPKKLALLCVEEGLFEQYGQAWYIWIHDKLQEAAFSLVSDEEMTRLQFLLGGLLLDELPPDGLELLLFVVVNLLNNGYGSCDTGVCRRLQLAQLNLRAGVKAIESASFEAAVWYLTEGIRLLPENHWEEHYDLSLELFSTAAQAEYSIGTFEEMESHCNAVLGQTDRPLYDKRRVYNTLMDSIGAQDRMGDAATLCMTVLEKLGCRFPKRCHALYTIAGLIHTQATLKKRTPEEITKLGVMEDPSKIWAMHLLDKLFTFLYQDKSDMVPLAILKSLKWTIKYGVSDVAMPNFASVGFMLAAFLGDFNGGEIYAKHALDSLEKLGSEQIKSRTLLVAYGSVLHWKTPFDSCRAPLLNGYHTGLKMGDVESGLWCIMFYLWFSLFLGTPLSNLSADLSIYVTQMASFKQKKHEAWTVLFLQTVLNLMGNGENTNKHLLVGEVVNEVELMKEAEDINILKPALNLFQMYAMFYFREHERVVKIIEENGDGYFEKSIPGVAALMANTVHSALSCIALARETGKSKYKKLAKKFRNKLNDWVKKGNPNVVHLKELVDAEWLSLKGKQEEAIKKYEVAIMMAGRRGLLQDRAKAHELFSGFWISIGDTKEGGYHIVKAVELYKEWGATAVAAQLEQSHPALRDFVPEVVVR